jgi:hypothetical protein
MHDDGLDQENEQRAVDVFLANLLDNHDDIFNKTNTAAALIVNNRVTNAYSNELTDKLHSHRCHKLPFSKEQHDKHTAHRRKTFAPALAVINEHL